MTNNSNMDVFCRNIAILRKVHGLTQKEMAKLMGVSVYCVRKLERGVIPERLRIDVIYPLCRQFGMNPASIFKPLDDA